MGRLLAMILLMVAWSTCGCGGETRTERLPEPLTAEAGPGPAGQPSSTRWPYWPRRMRIHPLTQLATDRETGQLILEVRIEFFDLHGHTGKGVGQLLIDLHDAGARGRESDPLETWAMDLSDRVVNLDHYDDLTRTYLFRLEFDPRVLPERPELRAYFRAVDGRRFQAEEPFQLRR